MPTFISAPSVVEAAGNRPKKIEEYIGRVNSETTELSIARMRSPEGWIEPGQKPEFDEYTLVLDGILKVSTGNETVEVEAGQAIVVHRDEWVQYSTPYPNGAEYIAVCVPAFSPETVHRNDSP